MLGPSVKEGSLESVEHLSTVVVREVEGYEGSQVFVVSYSHSLVLRDGLDCEMF